MRVGHSALLAVIGGALAIMPALVAETGQAPRTETECYRAGGIWLKTGRGRTVCLIDRSTPE